MRIHLDVGVFKTFDRTDPGRPHTGVWLLANGRRPAAGLLDQVDAVYLDVFEAYMYDPFGALKHVLEAMGDPDQQRMQIFPCTKFAPADMADTILQNDFGGCLRVYKELTKTNPRFVIEAGKFRYFVPLFGALESRVL